MKQRITEKEMWDIYHLIMEGKTKSEIEEEYYAKNFKEYHITRMWKCKRKILNGELGLSEEELNLFREMNFNNRSTTRSKSQTTKLFSEEEIHIIANRLMSGWKVKDIARELVQNQPERQYCQVYAALYEIRDGSTYSNITFEILGFREFAAKINTEKKSRNYQSKIFSDEDLKRIYDMTTQGKDLKAIAAELNVDIYSATYHYIGNIVNDIRHGRYATIIRNVMTEVKLHSSIEEIALYDKTVDSAYNNVRLKKIRDVYYKAFDAIDKGADIKTVVSILSHLNYDTENDQYVSIIVRSLKLRLKSLKKYGTVEKYDRILNKIDCLTRRRGGRISKNEIEEIRMEYFNGYTIEEIARIHRMYPTKRVEKIIGIQ